MSERRSSRDRQRSQAQALSDLPPDELLGYGVGLGLDLDENVPPEEILRQIRQRQELLIELDRDALLDVIVWSRRPVHRDAGKEELAREIARLERTHYDSLPKRGLVALARLRGNPASQADNAEEIIARLRKQDGLWKKLRRKRRSALGSLVAKLVDRGGNEQTADYQFLPEGKINGAAPAQESLKSQIEEHGVVGGLAQRIRGAADDYVRIKLDEIEIRLDAKLDQIDKRLAEWRDREVANRLRILRITLIFTVLVAILSLGYNLLKTRMTDDGEIGAEQKSTQQES